MTTRLVPSLPAWQARQNQWRKGEYPEWNLTPSPQTSRLVFAADSYGVAADQYRTVAKKLELRAGAGRRVLVTSPGPRDGKSTTASNLAWALSERGRSVLLIELDLRKPTFKTIFGGSPTQAGVERVLRGEAFLAESIFRISTTSLHVAAVDQPQEIAAKLIQSKRLPEVLDWAKEQFDWLVLDSPPVFPVSDVIELTSYADPVVMVVKARATRAALARRAIETLGSSLKFVIFNESEILSRSPYYYSEYRAALP